MAPTITQHTTTTELGAQFAHTLADLAVTEANLPRGERSDIKASNYALAAVRTIEATENIMGALGDIMPARGRAHYEERLAGSMAAAVWVTGLPEDVLRTNTDGPGFGQNIDEPTTADEI